MRKILLIILFFYVSQVSAYAHPGRTDSNGGHTCRTNCASWGLDYGEYHYHGVGTPIQKTVEANEKFPWGTIIFWGTVITLILGWIIYKIRDENKYYSQKKITSMETSKGIRFVVKETKTPIPPDEEVDFQGYITATKYRKNGFYVAYFQSVDGRGFTIVGTYQERLFKNKKCRIQGTLTYDRKYGVQIKVKHLEFMKL